MAAGPRHISGEDSVDMNPREAATIIAALTEWAKEKLEEERELMRQHPTAEGLVYMVRTVFGDHEGLTGAEIAELLSRIKKAQLQ